MATSPSARRRAPWIFAAVATAFSLLYLIVPSGLPKDAVYQVVSTGTLIAMVVGLRVNRPAHPWPWRLMAVAQTSWVIGDACDSWRKDVAHLDAFPSVTDVFYLAGYPLFGVALVLLVRARRRGRDLGGLLDSAILTAGLATLSWVLLARPTLDASAQDLGAAVVGVAYPALDILLAAVLIRLVTGAGGSTAAFRFLLGGVTLLLAGDTISTALSLSSSSNDAYYLLFLMSYVYWGVAALHPTMVSLSEPDADETEHFTVKRLLLLSAAVMIGPGLLVENIVTNDHEKPWPTLVSSVVMFALVVARMYTTIVDLVTSHLERDRLHTELMYNATHDLLTDLPNRSHAVRCIESALYRGRRKGVATGLLFIDLDGFKTINDTYGHAAGDTLLATLAGRLRSAVRVGDMPARLGGDEFVALLEDCPTEQDALTVAHRLLEAMCHPVLVDNGVPARVGASIGVAIEQDGRVDVGRLLREADAAAYRAKHSGGNRVDVFDETMRQAMEAEAELIDALGHAIRDRQLRLRYQPVVDLETLSITGFEALVRWERPGHGLLMPAEFIPTAEMSTLICEIDAWALGEATRQAAEWVALGHRRLTMAVNISARHLLSPAVVDAVADALRTSGLDPALLVLEITETALLDETLAGVHLARLHDLGVNISIDDFGAGYNTINRLRLPYADVVKTDRSFLGSADGRALLEYTVQVAHAFGLPVIVEGIEDASHLGLVRSLGCESAQGFLLGDPVTAAEAVGLVADRPPRRAGRRTPVRPHRSSRSVTRTTTDAGTPTQPEPLG